MCECGCLAEPQVPDSSRLRHGAVRRNASPGPSRLGDSGRRRPWPLWGSVSPSVTSAKLKKVWPVDPEAGTTRLSSRQDCGGEPHTTDRPASIERLLCAQLSCLRPNASAGRTRWPGTEAGHRAGEFGEVKIRRSRSEGQGRGPGGSLGAETRAGRRQWGRGCCAAGVARAPVRCEPALNLLK